MMDTKQSVGADREAIATRAHRLRVLHFEKRIPQETVAARLKGGKGVTRQYYNALLNGQLGTTTDATTDALLSEAEEVFEQVAGEKAA